MYFLQGGHKLGTKYLLPPTDASEKDRIEHMIDFILFLC